MNTDSVGNPNIAHTVHATFETDSPSDLFDLLANIRELEVLQLSVHPSVPEASPAVRDELAGYFGAHSAPEAPWSEPVVRPIAERVGHQATQIDDINRRLDDLFSRFNGLLADFNGHCSQTGDLNARLIQAQQNIARHESHLVSLGDKIISLGDKIKRVSQHLDATADLVNGDDALCDQVDHLRAWAFSQGMDALVDDEVTS